MGGVHHFRALIATMLAAPTIETDMMLDNLLAHVDRADHRGRRLASVEAIRSLRRTSAPGRRAAAAPRNHTPGTKARRQWKRWKRGGRR